MSELGQKQPFSALLNLVCFAPDSGPKIRLALTAAFDPIQTFVALSIHRYNGART